MEWYLSMKFRVQKNKMIVYIKAFDWYYVFWQSIVYWKKVISKYIYFKKNSGWSYQ